jgi:hypothetical protein
MKPLLKYKYIAWNVSSYENWARQCSETEDALLKMEYASELEEIYKGDIKLDINDHEKNLEFLKQLEVELAYVWSYSQRENANMSYLIKDYKRYFNIEI